MAINVKDCRHGRMMYYANDAYIGRSLEVYGEYSEDEIRLWSQIIKPGWTVFDVGANIGAHTVWLAGQVGPTGRVFAIEPQRQLYNVLCGNLALNHILNVDTMLGAMGDQLGQVNVPPLDYDEPGNFGGLSLEVPKPGEMVPAVPLDAMNVKVVHFIKIDVEGMEQRVIQGARKVMDRDKPIIYVENDRADRSESLITLLMEMGYRLFWHLPKLYSERNHFGVKENVFGPTVGVNMLCVHSMFPVTLTGLTEIRTPQDTSGVLLTEEAA